jgi:nucleoside-diphosphate-sugar epimerase
MILVTGGTGFIGSHLVDRLLTRGERVRALVRYAGSSHASRRNDLFDKTPVEVVRGDLASGEGLDRALRDVDTVFHLAGVTRALSTADYYTGNVLATENLARAIARETLETGRPIRLVHVSSLAAVGPSPDGTPILEDAEPHPIAHYGKSKLQGEQVVRAILPDAVIVRPPAVYGPRDTDVFQILKAIHRGIVVQIAGGERRTVERWFSAIYVSDLVDGLIAAAHEPRAIGRTYFLAHAGVVSWSELVGIASRIMGRTPRVANLPLPVAYEVGYCAEVLARLTRKPGIISRDKVGEMNCRYWVCDAGRAREEIGFEAPTPIDQGLANALAWYREAGWLKWA